MKRYTREDYAVSIALAYQIHKTGAAVRKTAGECWRRSRGLIQAELAAIQSLSDEDAATFARSLVESM